MLGGGTFQGAVGKKQQFLWLEAGMGDEDEETGREQETPSDWESGAGMRVGEVPRESRGYGRDDATR